MNTRVSKELEKILEDTTGLSFPVFANGRQKREQLDITKQETEEKIRSILSPDDSARFDSEKAGLWGEAEKFACEQFDTLPEKLKINSFYLQEVMHRYVESIFSLLSK